MSCLASFARLGITMDYPCGKYACPGSVSVCPITFIAYQGVYPIPSFLPLYETKGFKSVLIPTGDKTESKRASKDLASSARKHWDPLREGSRAARTWMECPQGWSGDRGANRMRPSSVLERSKSDFQTVDIFTRKSVITSYCTEAQYRSVVILKNDLPCQPHVTWDFLSKHGAWGISTESDWCFFFLLFNSFWLRSMI